MLHVLFETINFFQKCHHRGAEDTYLMSSGARRAHMTVDRNNPVIYFFCWVTYSKIQLLTFANVSFFFLHLLGALFYKH